jgi:hypothetical protein
MVILHLYQVGLVPGILYPLGIALRPPDLTLAVVCTAVAAVCGLPFVLFLGNQAMLPLPPLDIRGQLFRRSRAKTAHALADNPPQPKARRKSVARGRKVLLAARSVMFRKVPR